jgi:hypothetical protein
MKTVDKNKGPKACQSHYKMITEAILSIGYRLYTLKILMKYVVSLHENFLNLLASRTSEVPEFTGSQ